MPREPAKAYALINRPNDLESWQNRDLRGVELPRGIRLRCSPIVLKVAKCQPEHGNRQCPGQLCLAHVLLIDVLQLKSMLREGRLQRLSRSTIL